MLRFKSSLLIALLITYFGALTLDSSTARAAACCGGGFSAPSMIVGDDNAQISASYTHTEITDDIDTQGIWYPRSQRETAETLRLDGAHIAWDRFQFGGSVPVVERTRSGRVSTGFGDVSGTAGYEILPEWDYSVWRPRGFTYFQLTAPTGRDVNESTDTYELDARGRGFWSMAVGALLTKTHRKLDLFTSFDLHRSYDHRFHNSQASGELHPGWGGTLSFGAGYNLRNWRFGGALAWSYEDAIRATGDNPSSGAPQRFATATLSGAYLFENDISGILTYADQTWFGEPNNTTLGRSLSLLVQKRWPR